MDPYRMNCRNSSGNCRNRTCGNMTGNREAMMPMDTNGKTCTNTRDRGAQETSVQEHLQMLGVCANAEIRKGIRTGQRISAWHDFPGTL